MGQQLGDTVLTKVFVGGLAWETREAALREHFGRFGDILEAVIISDKITGRSKGYGFVTFKEAEAAKRACEDATPVIDGRRANCNLASLGVKRASTPSDRAPLPSHGQRRQPPPGMAVGPRGTPSPSQAAQWYYPLPSMPPPPFQLHHYHNALPFYPAAAYGRLGIAVEQHKVDGLLLSECCRCTTLRTKGWESLLHSSPLPTPLPRCRRHHHHHHSRFCSLLIDVCGSGTSERRKLQNAARPTGAPDQK
ncbi:hypothetical protein ZIOFF_029998 [Zingiber officinale]|uniref:RRM domain-containing protein n=1 Tax=Zingiber officinale TaxID=94328 RepID=A0A8J5LBA8_ZINOF|nr:hypothetical protein ZIOFF_029998 [Zingiber officinale]